MPAFRVGVGTREAVFRASMSHAQQEVAALELEGVLVFSDSSG